jgi:hypothetical protein
VLIYYLLLTVFFYIYEYNIRCELQIGIVKDLTDTYALIESLYTSRQMWKNMNDEQKQVYKDTYEVLIADYKKNNDVEKVD